MNKTSGNRLLVSAKAPSSSLIGQLLKGGTNIELSFILKVPQSCNLLIKHKAGDVSVNAIRGNISINNHAGEQSLSGRRSEQPYQVYLRVDVGEIRVVKTTR